MLGLLLLYFIGNEYHKLRLKYRPNSKSWSFILLGIAAYYFGTIVFGTISFVLTDLFYNKGVEGTSEFAISLIAVPFGILSTYLMYSYLKKKWIKEYVDPEQALEEIGSDIVNSQND
ncbi:MAG: hypothetical protein ACPGTP_08665 [Bacteroidia bacterium]